MNIKLKPLNLQAALKGEPVMLRDGSKAFVRHYESERHLGSKFTLVGIIEGHPYYRTWTKEGCNEGLAGNGKDIIGMYPKTHIVNSFEVPAPETKELKIGNIYFTPNILYGALYDEKRWERYGYDFRMLNRGLVFLNREDAIANAKAMLGIDPYEENEE